MLENIKKYIGLSVNSSKSKIYFSKGCSNKEELRNIIGFSEGLFPSKYLGLPLSRVYLKPRHFSSLIDKCKSKLEGWSMHTLSFSSKVELIKSVIHGIIGYWIQIFHFPESICNELDRKCANFLWKGKMHTWKLESLC